MSLLFLLFVFFFIENPISVFAFAFWTTVAIFVAGTKHALLFIASDDGATLMDTLLVVVVAIDVAVVAFVVFHFEHLRALCSC